MDGRTPVICGVGQVTHRGEDILEPLDLATDATRLALEDAGGRIASRIGRIDVVNIVSFSYRDPPGTIAERLGLHVRAGAHTTVGGNTPQWLVARACDAIATGRIDAVVVTGGEALDSTLRAKRQGVKLDRGDKGSAPECEVIGDARPGPGPIEMAANVIPPAHLYPFFESVLAHRAGRGPGEQRRFLGELMAPLTGVAASNPLAWFRVRRTAEEISEVTEGNRIVAEPYTKLMNAMIRVDQGAAVLLASAEAARDSGVPRDRWVFPWAGAECDDVYHPSARPDFGRSPGLESAGRASLEGVGIDAVTHLDLYSCFPSAVEIAADALGVALDDPRGLTVTGGLPSFGGPGSNYVTHAIAELVGRCREDPDALGLCTGVGWYLSKHAVGLYGGRPPPNGWLHPDLTAAQERIEASALPTAGAEASGPGRVVASTVVHDRERGPVAAPAIVRLEDGRQTIAVPAEDDLAAEVSGRSLIGGVVTLLSGDHAARYQLG